jgi:imidazolonepropionase-like amidohydrolase
MRSIAGLLALIFLLVAPAAADVAIVGARVYPSPGAQPLADATIVMRDGKIVAVGPSAEIHPDKSAEIIDGKGLVVLAGFWNSHVHLLTPTMMQPGPKDASALSAELETMLTRWGFTTVFDIASLPGQAIDLRKRIAAGEVRGPNILTVDAPFYPNDGVPIYARELLKGQPSFEVGTPATAAARAQRQIAAGADGVKIFAGSIVGGKIGVLPMPLDAAKAIVAEAHRAGKPAFAHPTDLAGLNVAIDSGVDVLAHTTPDGREPWSPELVQRLKAHNMALIPTLSLWRVELQRNKAPEAALKPFMATAQQQLKAYADAGGQILFGTDVGYTDAFDTTEEYTLMSEAGLTWQQILTSLTTAPASRFGFASKGRIEKGADADLTVLSADPATDVKAFAKVAYTIRGGTVIYAAKP